jgi:nicotinate-nucleotide adenylyltransferase
MPMREGAIAVFGGTFNPVHFGHLRSARELLDKLPLAEVRFVPAALPPHREAPAVSARDRAAMVALAIAGEAGLVCDRRELLRDGPSYTYDTLLSLREELGPDRPLALVMGCDAVQGLCDWHRGDELLDLAHIVVLARPGWTLPAGGAVAELLSARRGDADTLLAQPAGTVLTCQLSPQDISSTAIRALLQSGQSARGLVPDAVLAYLQAQHLYSSEDPGQSPPLPAPGPYA